MVGKGQDGNVTLDEGEEDKEDRIVQESASTDLTITEEMGDGAYYFTIHNELNGTKVDSEAKAVTPVQVNE